jgi:hypothetical protein
MPQFHFTMAILWLAGGVLLLAWYYTTGDPRSTIQFFDGMPSGWIAIILGLYNLARWWGVRAARQERFLMHQMEEERRQRRRSAPRPDYDNPDPTFNFTDEPPPSDDKVTR